MAWVTLTAIKKANPDFNAQKVQSLPHLFVDAKSVMAQERALYTQMHKSGFVLMTEEKYPRSINECRENNF